jgi:hypothetical protein
MTCQAVFVVLRKYAIADVRVTCEKTLDRPEDALNLGEVGRAITAAVVQLY